VTLAVAEADAPDADVDASLRFREATENDRPFILDSWLKSYRKGSPEARVVHGLIYYAGQSEMAQTLLKRSHTLLACDAEHPDEIWAWLCFEVLPTRAAVIHYAYTKSALRRFGLQARLLKVVRGLAPGAAFHTHQTDVGALVGAKYGSTFNPYLAR